jgi:hypothetical protein
VKNNVILLEKLIKDTQEDKIEWVKADKIQVSWRAREEGWKGEKKLTEKKRIAFILNYSEDMFYSEIRVFFINDALKVRQLIYSVDPGIFSFKAKRLIKKLIKILNEKNKEKVANRVKEILGPHKPIEEEEEEEENDDIRPGWRNFGAE